MFGPVVNPTKTTSPKLILPFYVFASLFIIVAAVLLFLSADAFTSGYFQPKILAITHSMALGWGTMMILGASHQLVPVLIENKLYSNTLGYFSFSLTAVGLILLIWSFYHFDFGLAAQTGALMILVAFIFYLINLIASAVKSKHKNVHATFVITGTLWMIITITLGVLLVFNFNSSVLSHASYYYLPLHAHLGIVGWFLMLVMGVGSRLIPMFMISKYINEKELWTIYYIMNAALILFYVSFILKPSKIYFLVSTLLVIVAVAIFIRHCFRAYKVRIRKKVDPQVRISIFSAFMMLVPAVILLILLYMKPTGIENFDRLALIYGFLIFFGWITAIIFGMTFKTLPFILWNKKFHRKAGKRKTPTPKDMFSQKIFKIMAIFYFSGLIVFIIGIIFANVLILEIGAGLLVVASILFNTNVFKMIFFKG